LYRLQYANIYVVIFNKVWDEAAPLDALCSEANFRMVEKIF
jgi:hypothetical protein